MPEPDTTEAVAEAILSKRDDYGLDPAITWPEGLARHVIAADRKALTDQGYVIVLRADLEGVERSSMDGASSYIEKYL